MAQRFQTLAKVGYGAIFVVFVPALLYAWEHFTRPLILLPAYGSPIVAGCAAGAGAALMAAGMWQLWHYGGGLPMNAFPPVRLVTDGIFRWIPHPIYTGFTLLCWAASMWAGSPGGLWLITPLVALACTALVLGHERLSLAARFGSQWAQAGLILPPDLPRKASARECARVLVTVFLPWLILFEVTLTLAPRAHAFALAFPGEGRLPFIPWTEVIYASAYLVVPLTPFLLRDARAVRRFAVQGWISIIVVFTIFWTIPTLPPDRVAREISPPTNALPSFHALWVVLAAEAIAFSRPKLRWAARVWAATALIGSVTSHMHFIADVLAAALLAPAILHYERSWGVIRRATEAVANSWRQWRIGPMRIINHGFYAGLGTFAGLCLITAATGPEQSWAVFASFIGGVVGAGLWAQWVEGSPRLLRPFGFYGGLLGVIVACAFFDSVWLLWAGYSLAGSWVQGFGRLRCLVQGCCHGAPASPDIGIVYRRAESRVTRIAHLGGIPIHAAPLYSILWNLFTGLVLIRVWICGAPLNLVCALWLILNGLGRFAEEGYRGEPQTVIFAGLRLYQWLAIASVLTGVFVSCVPGVPQAPPLALAHVNLPLALAGFAVASFALGADFPASTRRFARLT